ncbi:MAG: ABC transporter permease, partial [Burkholderiales bacterium]
MNRRERTTALLFFALLIGAWEIAARGLGLSALVLPPPSQVALALWQGLASGYLWPHLGATVIELLLGLVAGCAVG